MNIFNLISILIMYLMGIGFYFYSAYNFYRWNQRWNKKEELWMRKDVWIDFHSFFSLLIIFLATFFLLLELSSVEQKLCIQSIQEWSESNLFNTQFYILVNNQYKFLIDRPNQYQEGQCLTITKYLFFFEPHIKT